MTPRELIAKWRATADQQMAWSKESDAKQDGANSHTERARARIYRECADELDTLLSVLQGIERQQEHDKDLSRSDHPRVISTADPRGEDRDRS